MRSLDVLLVLWILVSGEKRAQVICAHWLSVVLRRAPPRIGHRQQLCNKITGAQQTKTQLVKTSKTWLTCSSAGKQLELAGDDLRTLKK